MRRQLRSAACLLITLLPLPVLADGRSDLERKLNELKGIVLTIRNFYSESKLTYDSTGRPLGNPKSGPWTLYGQVEVKSARLKDDAVELQCTRLAASSEKLGKFKHYRTPDEVRIRIQLQPTERNWDSVGKALGQIFMRREEALADLAPAYWYICLAGEVVPKTSCRLKNFPETPNVEESKGKLITVPTIETEVSSTGERHYRVSETKAYRVGNEVKPPKAIHAPDPSYPTQTRNAGLQGTVVLSAIVNTAGTLQDLHIVRPLGWGLDDAAAQAIEQWKFQPAMLRDSPVPVLINFEINFRLYK